MCLLIFTKENKREIFLNEDLTVYKVLGEGFAAPARKEFYYRQYHLHTTDFTFNEAFRKADKIVHKYIKEHFPNFLLIQERYTLDITNTSYPDFMNALSKIALSVNRGFHSAFTPERLNYYHIMFGYSSVIMYKCIIPKGSIIYKDETGLLVSNQIVIGDRLQPSVSQIPMKLL